MRLKKKILTGCREFRFENHSIDKVLCLGGYSLEGFKYQGIRCDFYFYKAYIWLFY
jgi:hypothetical protein